MDTKLLYMEDFNLLQSEATVVDMVEEGGKTVVILDQTVFYPQGGGQPYDKGILEFFSGRFLIEEVRFADGVVKHIGTFDTGTFTKGEKVQCRVNQERRILNSKLHSAGHLVDMAVTELKLGWIPGKGYHFPDGPYVEYAGSLEELDKERVKADLESSCNRLIREGREAKLLFMDKDQMRSVCHFVPEYIPEGKPSRVVLFGDFGVPCGGTHVNNIKEIGSMTIRKVNTERGNIKVGYDVER